MDMKRLNHLVALAEERNFRKAAERVHLTQPAFSRSIQAAEAEWNLRLFDRDNAQVRCTPAGAFVVDKARQLLLSWRALDRNVAMYRDLQIGELSLGMGAFAASRLLTPLTLHIRSRFPRVQVRVQVNNPTYLLPCVRREEHDFFVGDVRYAAADGAFAIRRIGTVPGGLYARSRHPLLARHQISMADTVAFGLATGILPAAVQTLLLGLMNRTVDEGLPIALECDDFNALKAIALASDAILVGSEDLLGSEIESGLLHLLALVDLPQQTAQLGVISLRGRSLSPVAEHAVNFLVGLMADAEKPVRARPRHSAGRREA
jgi:DNA-binding transcriptional LysR family regulator